MLERPDIGGWDVDARERPEAGGDAVHDPVGVADRVDVRPHRRHAFAGRGVERHPTALARDGDHVGGVERTGAEHQIVHGADATARARGPSPGS